MSGGIQITKPEFKHQAYIIPLFQITDYASFTNQPANDGVEIVSSSASDTQICTVWGTVYSTGEVVCETVKLKGTAAVATSRTDWGTIYGVFLGRADGRASKKAAGTITIREASADQSITTITAGNRSKGMVNFDIPGMNITIHCKSGNLWENSKGFCTGEDVFDLSGTAIDECIENYVSLLSDSTGATAQIKVWED